MVRPIHELRKEVESLPSGTSSQKVSHLIRPLSEHLTSTDRDSAVKTLYTLSEKLGEVNPEHIAPVLSPLQEIAKTLQTRRTEMSVAADFALHELVNKLPEGDLKKRYEDPLKSP